MEKYITNIKDLVILALTNGSEIKAKAEGGGDLSCFFMGMKRISFFCIRLDY